MSPEIGSPSYFLPNLMLRNKRLANEVVINSWLKMKKNLPEFGGP
jgi:hypothetical protein